jgi:hypothetical protein
MTTRPRERRRGNESHMGHMGAWLLGGQTNSFSATRVVWSPSSWPLKVVQTSTMSGWTTPVVKGGGPKAGFWPSHSNDQSGSLATSNSYTYGLHAMQDWHAYIPPFFYLFYCCRKLDRSSKMNGPKKSYYTSEYCNRSQFFQIPLPHRKERERERERESE